MSGVGYVKPAPTLADALHRALAVRGDAPLFGLPSATAYGIPNPDELTSESPPPPSSPATAVGTYRFLSYAEVLRQCVSAATALHDVAGLGPDTTIGICGPNVPAWMIADFAATLNGYMSVGVHTSWDVDKVRFVVDTAGMNAAVVSPDAFNTFAEASGSCATLRTLVVFDVLPDGVVLEELPTPPPAASTALRVFRWSSFVSPSGRAPKTLTGAGVGTPAGLGHNDAVVTGSAPHPDTTPYALMFTSGTTGRPKGVIVSQKRWREDALANGFPGQPDPVVVSYMALAHGADRGICWQAAFAGARVGFVPDAGVHEVLLDHVRAIKPTFFMAMSHFWNRMYTDYHQELTDAVLPAVTAQLEEALVAAREAEGAEGGSTVASVSLQELLSAATTHPDWGRTLEAAGEATGAAKTLQDAVVAALGGAVFYPITGGAHTSDAVIKWMEDTLMPLTTAGQEQSSRVKNSYGSSEFPGISTNGEINPMVDLELVPVPEMGYFPTDTPHPRGEIRVRHKQNLFTMGYWKNEEESAKVFRDGWYYTGDIGLLDSSGELDSHGRGKLHLIDRRKNVTELYVDGDSVWVETAKLEANVFARSPSVSQVFLHGDRNAGCLVAVVVPSVTFVDRWAASTGVLGDFPELCSHPGLVAAIQADLTATAVRVGVTNGYEIPGAVIVEPCGWSIESGGLSAVGKLARGTLATRYKEKFDALYAALEVEDEKKKEADEGEEERKTTTTESEPEAAPTVLLPASDVGVILDTVRRRLRSQLDVPRVKQNLDVLDWLDWEAVGVDDTATATVNAALDAVKPLARYIRENAGVWKEELKAAHASADGDVDAAIAEWEPKVKAAAADLLGWVHTQTVQFGCVDASGVGTALLDGQPVGRSVSDQLSERLAVFCRLLMDRQAALAQVYTRAAKVQSIPHPQESATHAQYQRLMTALGDVADRHGVQIPYQIRFHGWWRAPRAPGAVAGAEEEEVPPALNQSLGSAEVWCRVSGVRIEKDIDQVGTPRFHCLDTEWIDESVESHLMLSTLRTAVSGLAAIGVCVDAVSAQLDRLDPHHALAWAVEGGHFWQLRTSLNVKLEGGVGDWERRDTPAGFISRAFNAYANRLALGMPDPAVISFDPPSSLSFHTSPVVAASGMPLTRHDGYEWITYRQTERLAVRTAKLLTSLRGDSTDTQFVAICGYNSIEWAVTDVACLLSGAVSVGVHTTNDAETSVHVLNTAKPSVLACTVDRLFSSAVEGSDPSTSWSFQAIAKACPSVTSVIVLDAPRVDTVTRFGSVEAIFPPTVTSVVFLPDALSPDTQSFDSIRLPDPDTLPLGGRDQLVTLLFTSGTSGKPKGVMVSASGFFNDISEPVYVEPLVTASYIPLSHSSDRMKVFEFMGNGGRVGFATYGASNWLAHERHKKSSLVQSFGKGSNNVEGLFKQIRHLSPTAMSCPPRIWNGLYSLYTDGVRDAGYPDADSDDVPFSVVQAVRARVADMFGRRLKFVITGGAPTAPVVVAFAKTLFPKASFTDSYGATECGAITSNGVPIENKGVQVKLQPVTGYEVGAVDVDSVGGVGEMLVRSPNMSSGYFGQPDKTAAVFVDGWYRTGDVCRRVAPNRYTVLGRSSEAVVTPSGAVVFPAALESLLEASKLVSQVYVNVTPTGTVRAVVVAVASVSTDGPVLPVVSVSAVLGEFAKLVSAGGLGAHNVPTHVHVVGAGQSWTVANGMLNGQLKKRRKAFEVRYADAEYTTG